uniref:Peptidase A2 domain-containing protein n=1 Tax=Panagrolaimus davidi TaxID=227884 RepID=A0A914QLI6_9BILA
MNYLEEKNMENNNRNFGTLWSHICHLHNRQIDLIKTIIVLDPTAGSRIWLGRNDITASFAGQVLEIKQCTPVIAEEIIWNKQINGTCYNNVPVKWNNNTYFIKSGTTDLTGYSEKVECTNRPVSIFKKDDGQWQSNLGKANVLETPHDPGWHLENHPIQFDSASPFQTESGEIANEQKLLWSYAQKINDVVFQPPVEKKNKLQWIEEAGQAFVEKAPDAIKNFTLFGSWTNFKETLADLKFIIITVILIIGLGGLLIYFYPWISPWCSSCWKHRNRVTRRRSARRRSKSGAPVNTVELESMTKKNSFSYIPPVYNINLTDGKLPYITVQVNGELCETLVDSGAAISIISKQMAEKLNTRIRRMERNGRAANGSRIKFIGKTCVEIEISPVSKAKAEVAIAEDGHCPTDMILGHDLCKMLEVQIDFKAKKINLMGTTIPINVLWEEEVERKLIKKSKVMIPEKVEIKKGDNFLWGYPTTDLKTGTTWLTTQ